MNMKRFVVLVLVSLLLATAIGGTAAQDTKVINIAFVQDIDTLNYPIYSSQFFSSILTTLWNSPPWIFNEGLEAVPRLVTEIPSADNGGVSEDGRTITLSLRDDINWSDGDAITSADFVFTIDMFLADSNAVDSRSPYDLIESYDAPDERTVVVTFAEPYAPWLASLFLTVLPEHVLGPVFEADGSLDDADFHFLPDVSSGPFVVSEWEVGNFILFERNDNYFDGSANVDQIFVRIVPDDAAQVAALINGEMDMGIFIAPDDALTLQQNGVNVVTVPSGFNEGLYFNFHDRDDRRPFQELAIRQAIAYGLNRDGIAQDLLQFGEDADDHLVIADTFWHNTPFGNPNVQHQPYDPDMARQILEDAGWVDDDGDGVREKDGVRLSLSWATNQRVLRTQVQAVGQQQLAEIGIEVELVNLPSDIFFGSFADGNPVSLGDFDFWEFSNAPFFPDPNVVSWLCSERPNDDNPSGVNDQQLCDEELDALLQQQAVTPDPAARAALLFEAEQIMHDNLYWLPLWHDPDLWAFSARFENANLAGTTQFWNAVNWDVSS